MPTICSGECQHQSLAYITPKKRFPFRQAVFGYRHNPAMLAIAAWDGATGGCNGYRSDNGRALSLSLPVPTTDAPILQSDGPSGARATVVDPRNEVTTMRPGIMHSMSVRATPRAALLCTAESEVRCAEGSHQFIALDLVVGYGEDRVEGHLFARHCAELDEKP